MRLGVHFLCTRLGIKRDTLKRYCQDGVRLGFFWRYELRGHGLYIKYRSIDSLDASVASVLMEPGELCSVASARSTAIEMALHAQQRACQHAIHLQKRKRVFDISREESLALLEITGGDSGVTGVSVVQLAVQTPGRGSRTSGPLRNQHFRRTRRGKIHGVTKRSKSQFGRVAHLNGSNVFLKSGTSVIGASQTTVAEQLGIARSTVVKYTAGIPHLHIWIEVKDGKEGGDNLYRYGDRMYRRMPNLYLPDREVRRERESIPPTPDVPTSDVPPTSDSPTSGWVDRTLLPPEVIAEIHRRLPTNVKRHRESNSPRERRGPLLDKLVKLTHEKLLELAHSCCLYFRGQTTRALDQLGYSSLLDAVVGIESVVDQDGLDAIETMIRRQLKGKRALPHHCAITTLN